MMLLDFLFNSYRIYLQDQGERGVAAAAILMGIPSGVFAIVGVLIMVRKLVPSWTAPLNTLLFAALLAFLVAFFMVIYDYLYVSKERRSPVLPNNKLVRAFLYTICPVFHFGSFFIMMVCFKHFV